MTKLRQIYKCEICGNMVEVVQTGKGKLSCCDQHMVLMVENTEDASHEKHVPVVEQTKEGLKVSIGSDLHPMVDKHYIEWIQVIDGAEDHRVFLQPDSQPVITFPCVKGVARAYCNLHGLWRGEDGGV